MEKFKETIYHIVSLTDDRWCITLIEVGVLHPYWTEMSNRVIKYEVYLTSLQEAENCLKQKQLDNPNKEFKIITGGLSYDFSELDKLNNNE